MPRTASARRSHAFAGSLTVEQAEAGDLFFRPDLLDLGAGLLQPGPGGGAPGGPMLPAGGRFTAFLFATVWEVRLGNPGEAGELASAGAAHPGRPSKKVGEY